MDDEKKVYDEDVNVSFEDMFKEENFEDMESDEDKKKGFDAKAFGGKILDACNGLKKKAMDLLNDDTKMEGFFVKVEDTLNKIPVEKIPKVGPMLKEEFPLGDVGVMLSMVRAAVVKKYTDVSKSNILIALVCMLYLVNPFDIITLYDKKSNSVTVAGLIHQRAVW